MVDTQSSDVLLSRRRICEKVRFGELKTGILLDIYIYIYHRQFLGDQEILEHCSYSVSAKLPPILTFFVFRVKISPSVG